MGTSQSVAAHDGSAAALQSKTGVLVQCCANRTHVPAKNVIKRSDFVVYQIECRFKDFESGAEYTWTVYKRFREIVKLQSVIRSNKQLANTSLPKELTKIASRTVPTTWSRHEMRPNRLQERHWGITEYLQYIVGNPLMWGLVAVKVPPSPPLLLLLLLLLLPYNHCDLLDACSSVCRNFLKLVPPRSIANMGAKERKAICSSHLAETARGQCKSTMCL
jgi:hypothetical protein